MDKTQTTFKIGDRVRVINTFTPVTIDNGDEGVITNVTASQVTPGEFNLYVKFDKGFEYSWYSNRFELVSPEKTDEEFAEVYREARKIMAEALQELMKRGYQPQAENPNNIRFIKVVSTTTEI